MDYFEDFKTGLTNGKESGYWVQGFNVHRPSWTIEYNYIERKIIYFL